MKVLLEFCEWLTFRKSTCKPRRDQEWFIWSAIDHSSFPRHCESPETEVKNIACSCPFQRRTYWLRKRASYSQLWWSHLTPSLWTTKWVGSEFTLSLAIAQRRFSHPPRSKSQRSHGTAPCSSSLYPLWLDKQPAHFHSSNSASLHCSC